MSDPLLDDLILRKVIQQTVQNRSDDKKRIDNEVAKSLYHGKQITWAASPVGEKAKVDQLFLDKTKSLNIARK